MARPKKDGIYLNIKLDKELYHRLEGVCEEAGQTKTLIVERALLAYMDDFDKKQETLKKIADGTVTVVENEQADK